MTTDVAAVAERLAEVRERITRAGGERVSVVAVTKTFGADSVAAACAAGCEGVGESYAQELVAKFRLVTGPVELHFIGRLQSNKVRSIAPFVRVYETIDRESLATEVARRAPGARVLVQVITPDEAGHLDRGKGGCSLAEAPALVERCAALGLVPLGAMTVGPTAGPSHVTRTGFARVRRLVDSLGLSVCSMGMSDDFEIAVAEGSTQVRVGSALFGARPPRH